MKTRKILVILFMAIALLLLGSTISFGSYSAGSKTVNSGENFSITVTSSSGLDAYNLDLTSYDGLTFKSCSKSESGAIIEIQGGSIGYINSSGTTTTLGTYSFTAPKVTSDTKYTIKFLVNQSDTVTATVTVKATSGGGTSTTTPPPSTGTSKSNNANLSNFGIRPNDFTGFKAAKTSYSVTVPNNVDSIEVYANKGQSGQTISGTGTKKLQVGENRFDVTVTAEDGVTTKTYTVVVTRSGEASTSSNASLKNLGIKPNDFTGFKSGTTNYSVSVPYDVESIEVYAEKGDSSQTVTGTGNRSLNEGSNKFDVVVKAADGTQKTYTITVIRLAKEDQENPSIDSEEPVEVALASLEIENVTINEPFDPEKLEYTGTASSEAEKVVVKATANIESAKIDVTGAEEYDEGENTVRITVTSEDGKSKKTYVVKITKSDEEVLATIDGENTIPVVGSIDNTPNDQGGMGAGNIIFIAVIAAVTILGIALAVVYYRKNKEVEEDDDFSESIDFANSFSAKEAIKDTVSATSKLGLRNSEPETEDGFERRGKGRHF